ncbi:hypothetical protein BKA57DRAFT_164259 [Linnemannia elongata]|nr:hypothetical protein BKA57DRAFT_164259 [Linnemannia elongata]
MPSIHDFLLSHSFPCSPLVPDIPITLYFFLRPLFFLSFFFPSSLLITLEALTTVYNKQWEDGSMHFVVLRSCLLLFISGFSLPWMSFIQSSPIAYFSSFFHFLPWSLPMVNWKGVTNCKQRVRNLQGDTLSFV